MNLASYRGLRSSLVCSTTIVAIAANAHIIPTKLRTCRQGYHRIDFPGKPIMPKVILATRGRRRLAEQHKVMASSSSAHEHMPAAATTTSSSNGKKQKRRTNENMSVARLDGLAESIRHELMQNSDTKYQEWITAYMKDAVPYIGCKVPTVEKVVRDIMKERIPIQRSNYIGNKGGDDRKTRNKQHLEDNDQEGNSINLIIDVAFELLREPEGDVKISGMVLLSDHVLPISSTSRALHILERLEDEIFIPTENDNGNSTSISIDGKHVNDWATSDALSMRVLKKLALSSGDDSKLTLHVLEYATKGHTLWHRRCGLIPFLTYRNHLETLPDDIGVRLVDATEQCLQLSPTERFTQTGCAWLLRYILLEGAHCEYALQMIARNGSLWTKEARKSIVKRLDSNDPRRKQILDL